MVYEIQTVTVIVLRLSLIRSLLLSRRGSWGNAIFLLCGSRTHTHLVASAVLSHSPPLLLILCLSFSVEGVAAL